MNRTKLVDAVVSGFLGVLLAAAVPAAFSGFRARVTLYSAPELVAAGVVFSALLIVELAVFVFSRTARSVTLSWLEALPYGFALLMFLAFTFFAPLARGGLSSAYLLACIALLALLQLLRFRSLAQTQVEPPKPLSKGLACTSVLIVDSDEQDYFMLVLNKNLNKGKGLWVSPGGHFDLVGDDPVERLRGKIRSEVGIEADVWLPQSASPDVVAFSTIQAKWHPAPMFLLDEDLLGTCSWGHIRHLDLVWACVAKRWLPGTTVKYGASDRVLVPVAACAASVDAAEHAVRIAIERWHVNHFGARPGVLDTIVRGVIQRMYIASGLWLAEQQAKQEA